MWLEVIIYRFSILLNNENKISNKEKQKQSYHKISRKFNLLSKNNYENENNDDENKYFVIFLVLMMLLMLVALTVVMIKICEC